VEGVPAEAQLKYLIIPNDGSGFYAASAGLWSREKDRLTPGWRLDVRDESVRKFAPS
jgi:hypothetical protein